MLATPKRIDPRVSRTHKLLLEACRTVMMQKPFEEITIQDIASQATVNRATFYAHFADKYALIDELIKEDFSYLLRERLQANPRTTASYLRLLFLAATDHWTRHTPRCHSSFNQFTSLQEAQIKAQLRDNIHAWLREHLSPRAQHQHSLQLASTLLGWSLYGAATEWHVQAREQSPEAFADTVIPLVMPLVTALDAA